MGLIDIFDKSSRNAYLGMAAFTLITGGISAITFKDMYNRSVNRELSGIYLKKIIDYDTHKGYSHSHYEYYMKRRNGAEVQVPYKGESIDFAEGTLWLISSLLCIFSLPIIPISLLVDLSYKLREKSENKRKK